MIIDHEAREIMYLVGSVRLSIRYHSPGFCMEADLDLGKAGYIGQGRRSKYKVKVKGQVQRLRLNFWCIAVDIKDSACENFEILFHSWLDFDTPLV